MCIETIPVSNFMTEHHSLPHLIKVTDVISIQISTNRPSENGLPKKDPSIIFSKIMVLNV